MQTIGWAVKEMQNGEKVRRSGWNGKGMFLFLVPKGEMDHPTLDGTEMDGAPAQEYVAMFTAQANIVPWLCSQTDLLATDWEIAK